MNTIIVQIGNSDNKLTQREWANFVSAVDTIINNCKQIHFRGGSPFDSSVQNACWVFTYEGNIVDLKSRLTVIREAMRQDAVAITFGVTEFI
jgi:hypothetical protein